MNKPGRLYEAYIFDLDGTVYLGESLLPTVETTLSKLRSLGKRTVFLSNNPTRTRDDYAQKLTRLGLPAMANDVINSSAVMAHFLKEHFSDARLFVIGEESLCGELGVAGFDLTDEAQQVDVVIASFDRTFAYWKLQVAFDAIRAGARFFATNADRYCPVPGGGEPDAAAMIAAIEACTDTKVEAVVGKPSQYMAHAVLNLLDKQPEDCLMIGDRIETDVLFGLDAGMAAALTLTGATDESALNESAIQPTYIFRQLADLLPGDA
jgi:NagD protein